MSTLDRSWRDIVVSQSITISEAINVLNQTGKMFLLVADDDFRLLGNLTDGDLRKGLFKFRDFSAPISKIMNPKPTTVSRDTSQNKILALFQISSIRVLPIVDENNILLGCYFENNFKYPLGLPSEMIIMAGGFGKRMGNLTKDLPKPMLPIDEKPILEHIIAKAKCQGFIKIYIAVHYQAEKIISYFGDGQAFGVNIDYLTELEPLGTGGSIKLLPDGNSPVVVTNADIMSSINFRSIIDFHILTNATATMVTHEHVIQNPFGIVHTNGAFIYGLEEKPIWATTVNAGIYVINRSVCEYVNSNEKIDMTEIIQRLLNDNKTVLQYPTREEIYEIGSAKKYGHYTKGLRNARSNG